LESVQAKARRTLSSRAKRLLRISWQTELAARFALAFDEPALKRIAQTTGGSYHRAENADQLERALDSLPGTFTVIQQRVDTAAAFAAGGAVLIATALSLSLWWNRPRTPSKLN
jgi:Ca-activated chloride channel family protein